MLAISVLRLLLRDGKDFLLAAQFIYGLVAAFLQFSATFLGLLYESFVGQFFVVFNVTFYQY